MDDFETVSLLLDTYIKSQPEDTRPSDLPGRIKTSFYEGKVEIFVSRDKQKKIDGFCVIGLVSNSISLLYDTRGDFSVQESLLNHAVERLKKNKKAIMVGGNWMKDELWECLQGHGFLKFDRKFMQIERNDLLNIPEPICSDGIVYESYTSDMQDEVVSLIFEANENNIDVNVFPGYFGQLESVKKLIDDTVNNRFGEWREGTSKILRKEGEIIGISLLSVRGTIGYIPDIAIATSQRRQGLGRFLLIKSLQDLLKSDDSLTGIALDVTLENPARHLYESTGFKDVRFYSMYSWIPDSQ